MVSSSPGSVLDKNEHFVECIRPMGGNEMKKKMERKKCAVKKENSSIEQKLPMHNITRAVNRL